jgi:hypothetical protein
MDEKDKMVWRIYLRFLFGVNPLCKNYYEACLNENL